MSTFKTSLRGSKVISTWNVWQCILTNSKVYAWSRKHTVSHCARCTLSSVSWCSNRPPEERHNVRCCYKLLLIFCILFYSQLWKPPSDLLSEVISLCRKMYFTNARHSRRPVVKHVRGNTVELHHVFFFCATFLFTVIVQFWKENVGQMNPLSTICINGIHIPSPCLVSFCSTQTNRGVAAREHCPRTSPLPPGGWHQNRS